MVYNCISFLEISTNNGLSIATIATYISAVKAKTTISSHLAALTPTIDLQWAFGPRSFGPIFSHYNEILFIYYVSG